VLDAANPAGGGVYDPHQPLQEGVDQASDVDIQGWRSAISGHISNAALTDMELILIQAYSIEASANCLLALIQHIHQCRSRMDNHPDFLLLKDVVGCNTNIHMASFIYGLCNFKM
jgi:hypothetical protein